jgi:UDP:flavonoid glycosyltransferase YjiC (YdhE family)
VLPIGKILIANNFNKIKMNNLTKQPNVYFSTGNRKVRSVKRVLKRILNLLIDFNAVMVKTVLDIKQLLKNVTLKVRVIILPNNTYYLYKL